MPPCSFVCTRQTGRSAYRVGSVRVVRENGGGCPASCAIFGIQGIESSFLQPEKNSTDIEYIAVKLSCLPPKVFVIVLL